MFKKFCFLLMNFTAFCIISDIAQANQINGCYRVASGSTLEVRLPAEYGGGKINSYSVDGFVASRGDQTYSAMLKTGLGNTHPITFEDLDDNKQLVMTVAISGPLLTTENIVWSWSYEVAENSGGLNTDRLILTPTDSDGDGVPGAALSGNILGGYNLAMNLVLEEVGTDNNQVRGCFRFSDDSLATFSSPSHSSGQILFQEPLDGTLFSKGDGTYFLTAQTKFPFSPYFFNLEGADVVGGGIEVNGNFSYMNYPLEPIRWEWKLEAPPSWNSLGES